MSEADYASGRETGEMTVKFKRLTETATIPKLVLASVSRPEIEEIEEIDTNTMRGASGFGSTGMKGL